MQPNHRSKRFAVLAERDVNRETFIRERQTPANQAHITTWKEHPALLAANAADAAWRGFAEDETIVRVARNAPLNALAVLIGSQVRRGGVLTQCAVEEGVSLRLAIKGLTSNAETLSVYGTAAAEAKQALLEVAASELEAAIDDLEVVDGRVQVRGAPFRSKSVGVWITSLPVTPDKVLQALDDNRRSG